MKGLPKDRDRRQREGRRYAMRRQLEKTCTRWQGHNALLTQAPWCVWNRALVKLLYHSIVIVREKPEKGPDKKGP